MSTAINAENLDRRECVQQDDLLIGPLLAPRNSARTAGKGSIHDDATAQKLGFRGGTVAGSLHMEQFPPLLTHTFGDRWWQTGGMSLYFRYATTDQEAVRCFGKLDPALIEATKGQTNIWIEDNEEHLIAEGTASIGGADIHSALRMRIADVPRATDLRILKDLVVGDSSSPRPVRIASDSLAGRLAVITEPLEVYEGAKPYLPPSMMVQAMRAGEADVLVRHKDIGVGLFGAIEVQNINGPVYAEHDYTCITTVLAVSETPKTEYVWYESLLTDAESDAKVASMLMMLRFMKASSALWQ
jgi:hypothetical protein|tara:strand:+ start:11691 stop:12590 length:900 start_codon:yes stop_codon:yes gene_type:complete